MTARMPHHPERRFLRFGRSCLATLALLAVMASENAIAQTLTDPRPRPKSLAAAPVAKPLPGARMKTCSAFGAGFVQAPGSDVCIKIGGSAEGEAGSR